VITTRKGKVLTIPDTLIAATALHNQLILITDNTIDFPMKDLTLHTLPHTALRRPTPRSS
jgi:predicted nucleic acid-binding protein